MIPFYKPVPAAPGVFQGQPLPEAKANIVSRILYHWATPVMRAGYSRPLEPDDLWSLTSDLECRNIADQLRANLLKRTPPSKRVSPSHPSPSSASYLRPRHQRTTSRNSHGRYYTSSSRAYVKQARESMFTIDGAEGYAVSHDSAHLLTMVNESEEDMRLLSEDKEESEGGIVKKYGKKKAKRIEDGELAVEDGKENDMSLIKAMYATVWWAWWKAVIMKGCAAALQVTSPLLTKILIEQLTTAHQYHTGQSSDQPKSIGYGIGLSFALFAMVQAASLFSYQALQRGSVIGFMMRAALIDLISRKSMKLSSSAKVEMTSSKLTTMVSADASFLDFSAPMTLDLVVQPVQILVGLGLLIWTLGYSALVGVAVLALAGPLQAFMFTLMVRTRITQLTHVDARVRLLSETITSIRAVKLFAYVAYFSNKVTELRKKELIYLRKNGFNRASMNATMAVIPTLAAVLTFVTYGLTGHALTPSIIFSGLQYFNVLKTPIAFLPMCFTAVSDALVGIGRIGKLLRSEELPEGVNVRADSKWAVDVRGDYQFEKLLIEKKEEEGSQDEKKEEKTPFMLKGVDMRIPRGALVCVIGRVGSGKSALLAGLINEMKQVQGHTVFGGSVSYVPQHPWIHSGTVRDNITFSARPEEIDWARYNTVVDACALRSDIDAMANGDLTNVGEKGLLLSGGQRQRISLARAAYHPSSVILLDDPLSAVDAHVTHQILSHCIFSGPLAKRTRIMVTHQLDLLPKSDWIVVMENDGHGVGRVGQMGSWEGLKGRGMLGEMTKEMQAKREDFRTPTPSPSAARHPISPVKPSANEKPATDDTMEEDRQTGTIPWSVYTIYLRAMGTPLWGIVFGLFLILTQVASVGNSLLLGFWSSNSWGLSQGEYMAIYGALGIAIGLFTFGASYTMFLAGLRSSYTLFAKAWKHVMRAPMRWHDQTPSGRIINRLSKDIEMLDDRMAFAWETLLVNGLAAVGTFGLILYVYPWLGLAFIPLMAFYYIAGEYYRQTSREVKRIDSNTRSHIYSSFGEQASLDGYSVIRAFGKQNIFEKRMQSAINVQGAFPQSAYKSLLTTCRWLGVRLDFSSNLLILLIAIVGTVLRDTVDPSSFGVVFSYALAAAAMFSNLVSLYAQVELEMNNAERIIHYTSLPHEPLAISPSDSRDWPSRGAVDFHKLSLRYSPNGPWILKQLSFSVRAGEKVGVIGRTGAGKSSLVGALMRVVGKEGAEGKIEVDGLDINNVGLDTLRNGVGLIPQEAFLFEGSVRENLDPLDQHNDAYLNSLLDLIHTDPIMPATQSMKEKFRLDASVADGGSNFSGGEKQLLALIRALARGTKILLLDEATSSVDGETDALIQRIIQNHLKGVTLISIAHRLHTLAYYDRIMVLDQGRLVEYDSPLVLFDIRDSIFRQLCDRVNIRRQDLLRLRHDAVYAAQAARDHQSLYNDWTLAELWAQTGGFRMSQWSR
ncbi:hypothetical protein I350_00947 [Cryptococcus amylolentus CBS 6273]|uniref:Cadmium ion transporter n=1 Tax=Cryptococcus amylolentus CBS 6273 TaxID=1296118 RepID=A0A1E3KDI4_9TREE|nr:hypothetical protein I350_00947 [Cryptococcus amylolentus CBS 6273]